MKHLLTLIICAFALNAISQDSFNWYGMGMQFMNKNMSAVSPSYGDDHYALMNYPTLRGEMIANSERIQIDISGMMYLILTLSNQNSPSAAQHIATRTDFSNELIQDRLAWEWMSTKLKNPEGNYNYGFGWQVGMRRFGFGDYGLLKTGLEIHPNYPDAGPYSYRSTLSTGFNFQYLKKVAPMLSARGAFVVNGLVGIGKYGGMCYPELSLNLHFWRLAIIGTAAYETTFLYGSTQKVFKDEPADNTALIHGPRFDLSFAFNLAK